MKKFILGTIATATVIASVTAASAQMRDQRGWNSMNSSGTQHDQSYQGANRNFAPDSIR